MTEYNPEKTIVVVGYPRSGNTWLARLIAEALDSPMSRFGDALPIGTEGQDRPGDWFVTQLHLRLSHRGNTGNAICDAWDFNIDAWRGEKVMLIYRDPRDVAISAKHYWDLPSYRSALEAMVNGAEPLRAVGKWIDFYVPWLEFFRYSNGIVLPIMYEILAHYPANVLGEIVRICNGGMDFRQLEAVVANQQFDTKKKEIAEEFTDGTRNARPYGKTIQLKAMRKGRAYQWMEEMSVEDSNYACRNFEEVMEWMGYQTH